jgi:hypothetical protein
VRQTEIGPLVAKDRQQQHVRFLDVTQQSSGRYLGEEQEQADSGAGSSRLESLYAQVLSDVLSVYRAGKGQPIGQSELNSELPYFYAHDTPILILRTH